MLNFAICEIGGNQYKLTPGKPVLVRGSSEVNKSFEVPVLISVEDGKMKVGKPYLKDKIKVKCIEVVKADKIRVAKFHAKANYRKVTGSRALLSKIVMEA